MPVFTLQNLATPKHQNYYSALIFYSKKFVVCIDNDAAINFATFLFEVLSRVQLKRLDLAQKQEISTVLKDHSCVNHDIYTNMKQGISRIPGMSSD